MEKVVNCTNCDFGNFEYKKIILIAGDISLEKCPKCDCKTLKDKIYVETKTE